MASKYIEHVARLCHVQVSDLGIDGYYEIPAQNRIVKDFILQYQILSGDDFMSFMAEWGIECIARDEETGEILMKIALQRALKAVPHTSYNLKTSLPKPYCQYSFADAEATPMTAACWAFIISNIRYCLESLKEDEWQDHAGLIVLGLLQHLNEDGTTNDGFQWDEQVFGTSAKEAYDQLLLIAGSMLSFYQIVPALAPTWRKKRHYFRVAEEVVDWSCSEVSGAFKNDAAVDKQGNPYFSHRAKFFLKLCGLYQFALIIKIRQDMRTLPK